VDRAAWYGKDQAAVTVSMNTWPLVTNLIVAPGYIVLGKTNSVL
jgi:hypothetical protein